MNLGLSRSSLVIITAIIISGILISDKPAFASTVTWTGSGDGIHWSDHNNWSTGNLPASGDDIRIDGNNATNSIVFMDTNFVLTGSLTIGSGDELFSNDAGASLTNDGGTITNLGKIVQDQGLIFTNSGKLLNQGVIDVDFAPIFNSATGTITNSGNILNTLGEIENSGQLTNTNSGTISIAGSEGFLENTSTGNITSQGRIVIGDGFLRNSGNFVNLGTITQYEPLSESNIDNRKVINNWGYIGCCLITPAGFTNTGSINNICTGIINGTVEGNSPNTLPCPTKTLTGWIRVDVILTNVTSATGPLNMNVTLLSDNTLVPVVWKTKNITSPSNGQLVSFVNFHTSTPVGQFFVCASETSHKELNICTLYPLSKHQVTVTFDVSKILVP